HAGAAGHRWSQRRSRERNAAHRQGTEYRETGTCHGRGISRDCGAGAWRRARAGGAGGGGGGREGRRGGGGGRAGGGGGGGGGGRPGGWGVVGGGRGRPAR